MSKTFVVALANGTKVYVDTKHSHAATHLKKHPELLSIAKRILRTKNFDKSEVAFEEDVGQIIGMMDIVKTTERDKTVYAKRINRDSYTRFVKNRKPTPTPYVTMVLRKEKQIYDLWSVWIGRKVPPFPGDDRETPESRDFWMKHALVWGQEVQPGTETTVCPW